MFLSILRSKQKMLMFTTKLSLFSQLKPQCAVQTGIIFHVAIFVSENVLHNSLRIVLHINFPSSQVHILHGQSS